VESPALAQKVRSDWTNLSESDLREQLLKDAQKVENPFYFGYPFQRLRYYFPEEYAKQKASGPLSTKIEEFEKDEKGP
jgi:hypothetical protein